MINNKFLHIVHVHRFGNFHYHPLDGVVAVSGDIQVAYKSQVHDRTWPEAEVDVVLSLDANRVYYFPAVNIGGVFVVERGDDFVEEKTPVINNGQVAPKPTKVLWNKENFGDLAIEDLNIEDLSNPAFCQL